MNETECASGVTTAEEPETKSPAPEPESTKAETTTPLAPPDLALKAILGFERTMAAHPSATNVKVPPEQMQALVDEVKAARAASAPKHGAQLIEELSATRGVSAAIESNVLAQLWNQVAWLTQQVLKLMPQEPAGAQEGEAQGKAEGS